MVLEPKPALDRARGVRDERHFRLFERKEREMELGNGGIRAWSLDFGGERVNGERENFWGRKFEFGRGRVGEEDSIEIRRLGVI